MTTTYLCIAARHGQVQVDVVGGTEGPNGVCHVVGTVREAHGACRDDLQDLEHSLRTRVKLLSRVVHLQAGTTETAHKASQHSIRGASAERRQELEGLMYQHDTACRQNVQ